MQIGTYLLVIAFILSVSGWFDPLFKRFRLKKSYVLMTLLSCLCLSGFTLSVMNEFDINATVILLLFAPLITALQLNEYSILTSILHKVFFSVVVIAVMILIPQITLPELALPCALITGIMYMRKPLLAALLCSALPPVLYAVLLFTEAFLFVPYTAPDIQDALNAQILSLVSSLITSYAVRTITQKHLSYKKTGGNLLP